MHNKLVLLHYPPTVNWLPIDWLITFLSAPLPPPSLVDCKLGYISHPSLSFYDLDIIQFAYCHSIDFSRKMFAQKMVAVVVIRRQPLIWAAAIILDLPTYICGDNLWSALRICFIRSRIQDLAETWSVVRVGALVTEHDLAAPGRELLAGAAGCAHSLRYY